MSGDPLYIAWLKIESTGRAYLASPTYKHAYYRLKANQAAIDDWFRLCDEMMDAISEAEKTLRKRS